MNHWTRFDRLTDASLRAGRVRRVLVLMWVACAFVLALGATSAFAAASYNPNPLTGSKFQAADGNELDAPDAGGTAGTYDWQQVASQAGLIKLDAPIAGTQNLNCPAGYD